MAILKTRGKLLTLTIAIIVALTLAVNVIIYFEISGYITRNTLATNINLSMQIIEQEYKGDWRLDGGKLYKGNKLFNEDFEIADSIKKLANVECTILQEIQG